MAEEKNFSVEEALIDVLGFVKKTSLTFFDNSFRPWRIFDNTLIIVRKGKSHREAYGRLPAGKKYVSHFLYFVLALSIFLSYYKGVLYNTMNNLSDNLPDFIASTNNYIAQTSVRQIIFLYFPVIGVIYLLVKLISYGLQNIFRNILSSDRKNARYFFERIIFFTLATLLILLVLPVYILGLVRSENYELISTALMYIYLFYATLFLPWHHSPYYSGKLSTDVESNKQQVSYWHGLSGTLLAVFFVFMINVYAIKTIFGFTISKVGFLQYETKVRIIPGAPGDKTALIFSAGKAPGDTILSADILLTNTWNRDIFIDNDSAIMLYPVKNAQDTIFLFMPPDADSTPKQAKFTRLEQGSTACCKLVSNPVPARYLAAIRNSNGARIRYKIKYYPGNKAETTRQDSMTVILRDKP